MSKNHHVSTINYDFPLVVTDCTKSTNNLRRNGRLHLVENRIMSKRGRLNLHLIKIPNKSKRYVVDLWNTLVNMQWRWLLCVVSLINLWAYVIFTILFWLDAWVSGDFGPHPNNQTCINGIINFGSFFMLSVETITTTGYGYHHPTENCHFVFFILSFSTLTTIFIDGAFISVVYAKISRPKPELRVFSKKAVITLRNGILCFIIRINDSFARYSIDSRVNLYFFCDCDTAEGEHISNLVKQLKIKKLGMLFVPTEIVHEITPESPLWEISAEDLLVKRFEIIAVVTGHCIKTGISSQTQTSYLNKEILWGQRFTPYIEYDSFKSEFMLNKQNFNETVTYDIPLCSAEKLSHLQKETFNSVYRNL